MLQVSEVRAFLYLLSPAPALHALFSWFCSAATVTAPIRLTIGVVLNSYRAKGTNVFLFAVSDSSVSLPLSTRQREASPPAGPSKSAPATATATATTANLTPAVTYAAWLVHLWLVGAPGSAKTVAGDTPSDELLRLYLHKLHGKPPAPASSPQQK